MTELPTKELGLTAAVVSLTSVGLVIAAIIICRGGGNETQQLEVLGVIFAFLSPTITALLGMLKSFQNGSDIKELHLAVNSRLTQLLEQTALAAQLSERISPTDSRAPTAPQPDAELKKEP